MTAAQVEKVLDAQLGPTHSMAIRIVFGLAGCTAVAAAFPFLPHTHTSLLAFVAVLGMVSCFPRGRLSPCAGPRAAGRHWRTPDATCLLSRLCRAVQLSAIAFSTAYQLVQWFRHADIIALGLGGVGTGPLVLLLQLALGVGANPERWQWVAMFETTALIMTLGLFSALSLFAQYWRVRQGEREGGRARLDGLGCSRLSVLCHTDGGPAIARSRAWRAGHDGRGGVGGRAPAAAAHGRRRRQQAQHG